MTRYDALGLFAWSLIELVEAAARSREPELAGDALERLFERTQLSGTDWALGVEARSRALLSNGRTAEDLYLGRSSSSDVRLTQRTGELVVRHGKGDRRRVGAAVAFRPGRPCPDG